MKRRTFLQATAAAGAGAFFPHVAYGAEFAPIGLWPDAPFSTLPYQAVCLESQEWWREPGVNDEGQHIHLGCAFPLLQTISGKIKLHFRIVLHNQDSVLNNIDWIRVWAGDKYPLPQTACVVTPDSHGDAVVWKTFELDLNKTYNGQREFRCTVNMSKDSKGKRRFQSTAWNANVVGSSLGSKSADRPRDFLAARGWYADSYDYANAGLLSPYPFQPVSGNWSPVIQFTDNGKNVTHYGLFVDPDFHGGTPPKYAFERSGAFKGPVLIDTKKFANGTHRLVLASHQDYSGGRNTGVLAMPFQVKN
jgi:hypothetical protein